LEVLLDVPRLPRSTFFYHLSRLQGPDLRASLKAAITEIFKKNYGRYGHRRIHIQLLKQGRTVAKKTVLKLMRSLRWSARSEAGSDTTPTGANKASWPRIC
jgi:putative transposase